MTFQFSPLMRATPDVATPDTFASIGRDRFRGDCMLGWMKRLAKS